MYLYVSILNHVCKYERLAKLVSKFYTECVYLFKKYMRVQVFLCSRVHILYTFLVLNDFLRFLILD